MKLSLFSKAPSREEIEREVTEQIESLVRSGDKPPPPSWTLAGGLPEDSAGATAVAPQAPPAAPPTDVVETDVTDAPDEPEADGLGDPDVEGSPPGHTSPARPRSRVRRNKAGGRSSRATSRTS